MSRLFKLLLFLALGLMLVGALAFGALYLISGGHPLDFAQTALIKLSLQGKQDALDLPLSSDTTPIRFTVELGDPPALIAQNLVAAGLISDATLFVDYVRAYDIDVELEAGTYFLKRSQSIKQIAAALTDSSNSQIVFSIIPGWRMEEVAAADRQQSACSPSAATIFCAWSARARRSMPPLPSGSGCRLTPRWRVSCSPTLTACPPDATPQLLRDTLLDEFTKETDDAGIPTAAARQNLSIYEVVTLASIVQREAVHADEGAKIAGVYMNRLNQGMKLDADPTVQYGLGHPGDWWVQITQFDYTNTISPYNTYLNYGLPPGPIANPGLDAIRSAANPEASDYLYFQADCSGSGYHNFALTFEQHLANSC